VIYVIFHIPLLKNNKSLLVIFFLLLITIKTTISLTFPTPWIFADETVYDDVAKNILIGKFTSELKYAQLYPPGYPLFLSIAHLYSDKDVAYHIMLFINAILSSSIIFPAYFILKKFVNKKSALGFSILISCLPSSTLYSFVIMSENLFIPLFLLSCWFLIESSKKNPTYDILWGFSVFLLLLTRATGIAMIVGLVSAVIYIIIKQSKNRNYPAIKNKIVALISFALPSIAWLYYKSINATQGISQITSEVFGYNVSAYLSNLFDIFTSPSSLMTFLDLAIHEVDYIVLTTYFVFFILAVYSIFRNKNLMRREEYSIFLSYFLPSLLVLTLITLVHMYSAFSNGNEYYAIFGRYIAPLIAPVFIMGAIGLDQLQKNEDEFIHIIMPTAICLLIVFLITFPSEYYSFPNTFSIFYIQSIQKIGGLSLLQFIIILNLLVYSLTLFTRNSTNLRFTLFITFLTLFSLLASIPTLNQEHSSSVTTENANQIGRYLQNFSNSSTIVLMDKEDFDPPGGPHTWFLTKFWMEGSLIQHSTEQDPSGVYTFNEKLDYILSSKLLPYKVVATLSSGAYNLYCMDCDSHDEIADATEKLSKGGIIIDIGKDDSSIIRNFWSPENQKTRWTKNVSEIKFIYPKSFGDAKITIATEGTRPPDNPANVVILLNKHPAYSFKKQSEYLVCSFNVSQNHLNPTYQILAIQSNTWNPSDYDNKDNRELGIQIDWIKIEKQNN